MLVRKVVRVVRGDLIIPDELLTNRELYLNSKIKIGYGIMLIGVFCPFFWFALLSGAQDNDLIFYATHSFIVILFGVAYMAIYRVQLRKERAW